LVRAARGPSFLPHQKHAGQKDDADPNRDETSSEHDLHPLSVANNIIS
jgi:hypothetical protein